MKKFISSLLIAGQVLLVVPAFADPPAPAPDPSATMPVQVPLTIPIPGPAEPSVGAAISPLRKLQPATFTGVLLSPGAVAAIIAEFNSTKSLIQIEVDKARADEQTHATFATNECKATAVSNGAVFQAQLDSKSKELDLVTQQLKKAEDSKSNVPLWTGLGFGAGIIITVVTVFAINKAQK